MKKLVNKLTASKKFNKYCVNMLKMYNSFLKMERFIIFLKEKTTNKKQPSQPSWLGGFRASMIIFQHRL